MDAIAALKQATKFEPDDADGWCYLGDAYQKASRTDDAIAAYRQAIKLDPKCGLAMYAFSETYAQRKDFDEAKQILLVLERVDRELASEAWHNLGVLYDEAGRKNEARDAYRRATKLEP